MSRSASDAEAEAAKTNAAREGDDDAPPNSEVVGTEQQQPAPAVDPTEDAKSPVERPSAPEGKKLFIGGISWRSDEGQF